MEQPTDVTAREESGQTTSTRLTRLAKRARRHELRILGFAAVIVFFVAWELVARLELIEPLLISSPTRIVRAASWLFDHGFTHDILVSLTEFVLGFTLAVAAAVPLGMAMGWSARVNAIVDPFVQALNATPRVALIPLIIIWLGIGLASKVAFVFLSAFFPILLSAIAGVRSADETLLKCARIFGATDSQVFRSVILPGSTPWLITGMRIGVGRAVVGVVVAELIAANAGVGHMLSVAGATFQTDKVYTGVLLLAAFGYFMSSMLGRLEKRFQIWKST